MTLISSVLTSFEPLKIVYTYIVCIDKTVKTILIYSKKQRKLVITSFFKSQYSLQFSECSFTMMVTKSQYSVITET